MAGDLSGVVALKDIIEEVRRRNLNWEFVGSGASFIRDDMEVIADVSDVCVTGFTEIRYKWKEIRRFYEEVKRLIKSRDIDFVLLVDYPGFNMRVGKIAHKAEIPVFYYIPPQVWAWKSERAKVISRFSTFIFVIFPFEKVWFEEYGGRVEYVGNPVLWRIKRRKYKKEDGEGIVFMPGSRRNEFRAHYSIFKEVMTLLRKEGVNCSYKVVVAETVADEEVDFAVRGDSLEYLARAKVAICASGTAVLESFLMGIPTIVVYKTSYLTYLLGRMFVRVKYLSIPNIVFNHRILSEYIQRKCSPVRIAKEVKKIIHSGGNQMNEYMRALREYLDTDAPPEYKVVSEIERWI